MSGPGQYLPDVTEGITRPEDLPKAKIVHRSRNFSHRPCPRCDKSCFRNRTGKRILHDIGDLIAGRPRDIHLVYSQHRCTRCRKYFNADMSDYALPKSHYTHRVVSLAVRLVVEDGLPYQTASWHLWRDHRVFVPYATTDASPLYPKPLQAVFADVRHQICEFHIIKELTKAILRAVAKVRKKLAERKPTPKSASATENRRPLRASLSFRPA